jgi:hypothetical protein
MYPLADPRRDLISRLARDSAIPDEVPLLLGALLAGIQTVLNDNLLGMYLRGSLAMGDFDLHTSMGQKSRDVSPARMHMPEQSGTPYAFVDLWRATSRV